MNKLKLTEHHLFLLLSGSLAYFLDCGRGHIGILITKSIQQV